MNEKNCENCSHCTSIPCGENGFECCKLVCDKACKEFHAGEGKPGTCARWNAKGVPFYLQSKNND